MGPFGVSLLLAVGASAWVYQQTQRRNGGLTQQSLTVAAISAVVLIIIFYPIANSLLN